MNAMTASILKAFQNSRVDWKRFRPAIVDYLTAKDCALALRRDNPNNRDRYHGGEIINTPGSLEFGNTTRKEKKKKYLEFCERYETEARKACSIVRSFLTGFVLKEVQTFKDQDDLLQIFAHLDAKFALKTEHDHCTLSTQYEDFTCEGKNVEQWVSEFTIVVQELETEQLPVPFPMQRVKFMKALPSEYKTHVDAENRDPPKDLEQMMKSLLAYYRNSGVGERDEHQDSSAALSAHEPGASNKRPHEDLAAGHDKRRKLCTICDATSHDWVTCANEGGPLDHLSTADRQKFLHKVVRIGRNNGKPVFNKGKPAFKNKGKPVFKNKDAKRIEHKHRQLQALEAKQQMALEVRLDHKIEMARKATVDAQPTSFGGGFEYSDDEDYQHRCEVATTTHTNIDIITPSIIDDGGTTDVDGFNGSNINGSLDATNIPTALSVGDASTVAINAAFNGPSNNEHNASDATGGDLTSPLALATAHVNEEYITPFIMVLLLLYTSVCIMYNSSFGFFHSRAEQRTDSLTSTDPYTGEQIPKKTIDYGWTIAATPRLFLLLLLMIPALDPETRFVSNDTTFPTHLPPPSTAYTTSPSTVRMTGSAHARPATVTHRADDTDTTGQLWPTTPTTGTAYAAKPTTDIHFTLDSGATAHFVPNNVRLQNLRASDIQVTLADGSVTTCTDSGSAKGLLPFISNTGVQSKEEVTLDCHRGDFDTSLMSVHQLCKSGFRIVLSDNDSYIEKGDKRYPVTRTELGFRVTLQRRLSNTEHARCARSIDEWVQQQYENDGRLDQYGTGDMDICEPTKHAARTLHHKTIGKATKSKNPSGTHMRVNRSKLLSKKERELNVLRHRRLGCASNHRLSSTAKSDATIGLDGWSPLAPFDCTTCISMTGRKAPFQKLASTRSSVRGGRIHSDMKTMKTRTKDGYKYVLLFVDDCTRKRAIYLMKHKDELLTHFTNYVGALKSKGVHVRVLRSDNGGEYLASNFRAYCQSHQISQEFSPPRCQSSNGVAEVSFRDLFAIAMHPPRSKQRAPLVGSCGTIRDLHRKPSSHRSCS
jgi:hypothetical protein